MNFLKFFIGIFFLGFSFECYGQNILSDKKKYYDKQYTKALASGDPLELAEAYYLYGKYFEAKGEYAKSINYFFRAIRIHENYPFSYDHGRVWMWLSLATLRSGQDSLAISYLRKSKSVFEKAGSTRGVALTHGMLRDFKITGIYLDSRIQNEFYDPSIKIVNEIGDSTSYYQSLNHEAHLLFGAKKYKQAAELFYRIRKYEERDQSYFVAITRLFSEVDCYFALGDLKKCKELLYFASTAMSNHLSGHLALEIRLYEHLCQLSTAQKRWEEAYHFKEKLSELEKKALKANENGAITKLQLDYETEKKENELLKLNRDLNKKEQWIWAITILALMALLGFFIFYLSNQKNRILKNRNLFLLKEQNHRVKNNLQMVHDLLDLQGRMLKDAGSKHLVEENKMRIHAMGLLQKLLYSDNNQSLSIPIDTYLEQVANEILTIYGFENKITIEIESAKINVDNALSLGLLCTELLTNACKYAKQKESTFGISFKRKVKNGAWEFVVWDNGSGFEDKKENWSFGRKLIDMQARQLRGEYAYTFEKGTSFTLNFRSK